MVLSSTEAGGGNAFLNRFDDLTGHGLPGLANGVFDAYGRDLP
jgi:hypothetical protein